MQNYILGLVLLFGSITGQAAGLQWDASVGADGYDVHCDTIPSTTPQTWRVVGDTTYTFDPGWIVIGTRYECYVTAYNVDVPQSVSSNIIRFTADPAPITIETPPAPQSITILVPAP